MKGANYMSCTDTIIDKAGEQVAKALVSTVKLVGKAIAIPFKVSAWSITILLRGSLYIANAIHESLKTMIEEHRIEKELLQKEECQRIFELDKLLSLNFQQAQELRTIEIVSELSEQELEIKAQLYVELLNTYENEREIVFPDMIWKKILELKNVDFFNLTEKELEEKRNLINEIESEMLQVDEKARAVIYALNGKEYITDNESLCLDEEHLKEQCLRLLSMWIDFENALSCKHQIDVEILNNSKEIRINNIRNQLDEKTKITKEKIRK